MVWETYLLEQQSRYQDELLEFLSIPSISALPEHADDVHRAALWVANPLHALTHILASMRSAEGKILVEGFYDAVVPLSEEDRRAITAIPFDEKAYKEAIGIDTLIAEPGFTPQEHLAARPTLEINGIWGGFQGEGIKTVLPNEVHAKITCRLVDRQDPATIVDLITQHVQRYTPPGVRAVVRPLPGTAKPYLIPSDYWGNRIAETVLKEVYGKSPLLLTPGWKHPCLRDVSQHSRSLYREFRLWSDG